MLRNPAAVSTGIIFRYRKHHDGSPCIKSTTGAVARAFVEVVHA